MRDPHGPDTGVAPVLPSSLVAAGLGLAVVTLAAQLFGLRGLVMGALLLGFTVSVPGAAVLLVLPPVVLPPVEGPAIKAGLVLAISLVASTAAAVLSLWLDFWHPSFILAALAVPSAQVLGATLVWGVMDRAKEKQPSLPC